MYVGILEGMRRKVKFLRLPIKKSPCDVSRGQNWMVKVGLFQLIWSLYIRPEFNPMKIILTGSSLTVGICIKIVFVMHFVVICLVKLHVLSSNHFIYLQVQNDFSIHWTIFSAR